MRQQMSQMHGTLQTSSSPRWRGRGGKAFVDIARVLPLLTALAPGWIESYVGKLVRKQHFRDEPAAPSPGNLFEPMTDGDDISGGWRNDKR